MKKLLVLVLVVLAMLATAAPVFGNGVEHRVSAGGPDVCEALGFQTGCDANFSLEALEFADGTVKGQYTDRFPNGGGLHATIDCLEVDGNEAWVSGVVTSGSFEDLDLAGFPVAMRMVDNGTSANETVDQISRSFLGSLAQPCTVKPEYLPLDAPDGQVIVK